VRPGVPSAPADPSGVSWREPRRSDNEGCQTTEDGRDPLPSRDHRDRGVWGQFNLIGSRSHDIRSGARQRLRSCEHRRGPGSNGDMDLGGDSSARSAVEHRRAPWVRGEGLGDACRDVASCPRKLRVPLLPARHSHVGNARDRPGGVRVQQGEAPRAAEGGANVVQCDAREPAEIEASLTGTLPAPSPSSTPRGRRWRGSREGSR
jgi:hypothetical protein